MKSVLGDRKAITLLLTPALLVYTLIILVPVAWSFGLTFFSGSALEGFEFVGLENFSRLFSDPYVWDAFWFTIKYALLVTLFQVVLGYGLALLYNFVLRKSSVLVRTLVFFPVVLPTVAIEDVTPTVLYLLGLPVAPDMDGRVLSEALRDERLRAEPIAVRAQPYDAVQADVTLSTDDEAKIQDMLEGLGYV